MRTPLLAALALLLGPAAQACTTFCLAAPDGPVFGRNYDFETGHGLVLVNKRNVAKTGSLERNPARWTSRYGSLTFNQFGRDQPTGGVNERGLVVELMWLDGTAYPPPDSRAAVGTLEWIQYLLDSFATVEEVLAGGEAVRIEGRVPIHFLVSDRAGATATLEFLDGRLVAHRGGALPVPALANDRYDRSLEHLRRFQGFGGTAPLPEGRGSLDRFVRAAAAARAYDPARGSPVEYGFETLDGLAQGPATQWQIVYDLAALQVHFRTAGHPARRRIDLAALDWSCRSPVRMLDMNGRLEGDVTARFADYTTAANAELMVRSYRDTSFLKAVPALAVEAAAAWPERTAKCIEAAG